MLDIFGMRPIQEHQRAGDQVRRLFVLNSHRYPVVAIAFVRAPGREPTVYLHFPRSSGGTRAPFEAAVPYGAWEEILERSRSFERQFVPVPPPPANPGDQLICLDAWEDIGEATDPALGETASSVRRAVAEDCEDRPMRAFARDLRRTAIALFPYCDRIDEEGNSPHERLAMCGRLRGDRLAAADGLNRVSLLQHDTVRHRVMSLFSQNTRINWNGSSAQGDPGDYWVQQMAAQRAHFDFEYVEGEAANRVRVVGYLERDIDVPANADPIEERAPVEIIMTLDPLPLSQFQVVSITVGAWATHQPPR